MVEQSIVLPEGFVIVFMSTVDIPSQLRHSIKSLITGGSQHTFIIVNAVAEEQFPVEGSPGIVVFAHTVHPKVSETGEGI